MSTRLNAGARKALRSDAHLIRPFVPDNTPNTFDIQERIPPLVQEAFPQLEGVQFDVVANNDQYVNHLFIRWMHEDADDIHLTQAGVEIYAGSELRFVTDANTDWSEETLEDWHREVAEFVVRAYLLLG